MRIISLEIVRFNNRESREVGVYELDTYHTLSERFAYIAGTIPKYIHVPEFDVDAIQSITVTSLWEPETIGNANPFEFYNRFKPYFSADVIITFWANFYNGEHINSLIAAMESQYPEILEAFTLVSFDTAMQYATDAYQREQFQREYFNSISDFQRRQLEVLNRLDQLRVIPEYRLTLVKSDEINISGSFASKGDLNYIFDQVHASRVFPIISFDKYYKTVPHFTFREGWTSFPNRIRIKMNIDGRESELNIEKSIEDAEMYTFRVSASSKIQKDAYSEAIKSLLKSFNVVFTQDVEVYHYQMDTRVNLLVLSDILLTNPWFEPLFAMNNRRAITDEYGDRKLYFRNVFAQKPQVVEFPITQTDSGARFTLKETDNVILVTLSKLLRVYTDVKAQVISDYARFGIKITHADRVECIGNATSVSDRQCPTEPQQRDLLGAGWSSRCQPTTRHPIQITRAERDAIERLDIDTLRELEQKINQPKDPKKRVEPLTDRNALEDKYRNKQILQFPKDEDSYFICIHPDYPYPGVLVNEKSEIGFQPCCYKTNKQGSKAYRAYYEGDVRQNVETSYIITKDKIITRETLGEFSPVTRQYTNLLYKCFQNATKNTNERILRYGIEHTPNSFLECVLTALGMDTSNIQDTRKSLLDDINPSLLRQEMYAFTEDEIREYIMNTDEFLNPLYTIRLLEYRYKCNILIFRRDEMYPEGTLSLPYHSRGYMQWKRDTTLPTIMVYMHSGAPSDNLEYPHCELLIHAPKNISSFRRVDQIENAKFFYESNPIAQFCWNLYQDMGFEQLGADTFSITPLDEDDIKGQELDEHGKLRFILVRIQGIDLVLETPPYPPLNKDLIDAYSYLITPLELERLGKSTQLDQNYGLIAYPEGSSRMFRVYTTDATRKMYANSLANEKVSRYLTEWTLYRFSEFLDRQRVQTSSALTRAIMEEFINSAFVIRDDYVYDNDAKALFTRQDAKNLLEGDKIVCASREIRNRLVFQAWRELVRREYMVLSYKDRGMMRTYYQSIEDFHPRRERLFLYDPLMETSFLKILATPETFQLYTYPQNLARYFLQHPRIEQGRQVHVENFNDIKDIVERGFDTTSLMVYVFESDDNVDVAILNEEPSIPTTRILITKFDDTILYGKMVHLKN